MYPLLLHTSPLPSCTSTGRVVPPGMADTAATQPAAAAATSAAVPLAAPAVAGAAASSVAAAARLRSRLLRGSAACSCSAALPTTGAAAGAWRRQAATAAGRAGRLWGDQRARDPASAPPRHECWRAGACIGPAWWPGRTLGVVVVGRGAGRQSDPAERPGATTTVWPKIAASPGPQRHTMAQVAQQAALIRTSGRSANPSHPPGHHRSTAIGQAARSVHLRQQTAVVPDTRSQAGPPKPPTLRRGDRTSTCSASEATERRKASTRPP